MKKIISLISVLMLILCAATAFSAPKKNNKVNNKLKERNINVIIDGNDFPGVCTYEVGSEQFFSIKEIAEIYNASLEWKPVSSMVTMNINNKKIDIKTNSNIINFGKDSKKLNLPTKLFKNELYISPEFLLSNEFSEITQTKTEWNKESGILNIIHDSNINAIRYFTEPDSTEIIIELQETLPYTLSKGPEGLILNIHRGQIQRDSIYANTGMIKDIVYDTVGKTAEIKINLQQTPKLVKSAFLYHPERIRIKIEHTEKIDITHLKEITIPEIEHSVDDEDKPALSSIEQPEDIKVAIETKPEEYGDAQITETVAPMELDKDNEDLAKVPVVKFEETNIIDDSYSIIDDPETIAEMKEKSTPKESKPFKRKRIIVIDAGHGGEDPGAVGPNGTKEKDINLSIAHELNKIFKQDEDFEVILTRKDDTFIPLVDRTNIANENHADLFISIHCNASFNRSASGFEVYFLSEKATDSEAAATAVLENSVLELEGKPTKKRAMLQEMLWSMMVNEYINESAEICSFVASETPGRLKIPNRGVKQASFYVLRGAQMPSILVESAFLSNYSEEARLKTKKFQAAVADSIYEGIKKYYARKDKLNNQK